MSIESATGEEKQENTFPLHNSPILDSLKSNLILFAEDSWSTSRWESIFDTNKIIFVENRVAGRSKCARNFSQNTEKSFSQRLLVKCARAQLLTQHIYKKIGIFEKL